MNRRLIIELLCLEKGKSYGFHEYVFNLLNHFYQRKEEIQYEQVIIWCKDSEIGLFDRFVDKFDIIGFNFSSYFKRHWLQSTLPLKYGLTRQDLLFSPGNISGLIKKGTELLTIHDLLFKRKEWLPSKLMRLQRELLMPTSINKADKIIAISQFTRSDVEHYYPFAKGKIEVVYNSMDFSKYDNSIDPSLPYDYFLAISTNYNYKNQQTIIKAFKKYCDLGGDKHLLFVGNISPDSDAGEVYEQLDRQIKERVVFKSHITNEEIGGLYKNASCFISASLFEGLGMPVVEAMSFGLPVLLSDIPPHREVSMNKGFYFAPTDYESLAKKMFNMNFGKCAYDKEIRDVFSDDNTSAKYVEIINSLFEISAK